MGDGEKGRIESPDFHRASPEPAKQRLVPDHARRALLEAAERRAAREADASVPETGGRGGLEPVRYGDWEVKGLASDF